jgi:3-oxoacyl-[acyl-carrier protein] reductase
MRDMTRDRPAALVVGGSGTLGRAIATGLAADGHDVAVGFAGGEARAEETAEAIAATGARAATVRLDVTDPRSVTEGVAGAVAAFGRLDAVVVSSGIARAGSTAQPGDIESLTPEIFDLMLAVNLRGPFLVARAAAPHLRAAPGGGRIVLIGSTVGMGRWGAEYPFAPSKAALAPLTRYLAATLAPDIAVNCVAPGLMENTGLSAGASEGFVSSWRDAATLRKTTSPADVAAHVRAFCASGSATGQVLVVDGGLNFA